MIGIYFYLKAVGNLIEEKNNPRRIYLKERVIVFQHSRLTG
jgi:hypothetical protein